VFGDFRLEPCLYAEASRVVHYSILAALPWLTFSAAAEGVTDPRADPLCGSKTGRAGRRQTIYAAMKGVDEVSDQTERNIEVVKKGYEAFSAGDIETLMSVFDDNIEWVQPGDSAISGTYRGKRELGDLIGRLAEKSATVKLNRLLGDGDIVVGLTDVTAGGETGQDADVFSVRDGKIVRAQVYSDTAMMERVFGRKQVAAG
jgi:uncharacterized protein